MDFITALNVTIYGLGIVFLALLVVMFAIMLLSRLFAVATGKDFMAAPTQEAPARPATASAVPAAAPSAPAPAVFEMVIAGARHKVAVTGSAGSGWSVALDGQSFQVSRDAADAKQIVVNGKAHTVEVKESAGSAVGVVVDGVAQSVEVVREKAPVAAPVAAQAAPVAATVAAAPVASGPAAPSAAGEKVTAPLPGKILSVAVKAGDAVQKGDELCVIEAMKMGNSIKAQSNGTVLEVLVASGDAVSFGTPLFVMG